MARVETEVELPSQNEVIQTLTKRALIYLRGIRMTEDEIRSWLRDRKRCRLYIVRDGRKNAKVHFRLSCFDRRINRRLHETYGIGCREPWNETMWTRNVARLAVSTSDRARPRYMRPVSGG